MTHTSDFSYLSRAMSTAYTSLWFLQHVWFIDRFASLRWNRVKRFELKSVITLLLLLICPLEAIYDISIVVIKYQEGYLPDPFNPGEYRPKIQPYWSKKNQDFVVPINYVLCANLSVQTAILFPTLQFCFSSNQLNSELAPQFAYGIIMLIIALLGFRSDYRFKKLLMHTRRLNPTVNVLNSFDDGMSGSTVAFDKKSNRFNFLKKFRF
nr:360_t:CDS:2 [Entrophospora candida]